MLVDNINQSFGIVLGPEKSNFVTKISHQLSKKRISHLYGF